jgi:hypothetical protein
METIVEIVITLGMVLLSASIVFLQIFAIIKIYKQTKTIAQNSQLILDILKERETK